ncbi:DUF4097 family beta strand repeat-containing protein [Streptosporangium sp. NPDC020072]|uniref:DUF4097 family beta strand repeat-containing protein n=1 Tax=Streptosporangium sp. NPDC020072 TaxID=3154788 RepID=UPI00342B98B0
MHVTRERRGSRPLWLAVGGTVFAFTVLACVVTLLSWLGRQSETQRQEYRRPARLQIDVADTQVVLHASYSGTVEVERWLAWSSGKPVADEVWQGDTLRLSLDCPSTPHLPGCSTAYHIWVPADLSLAVTTSSGEVRLENLSGMIRVDTDSGNVEGIGLGAADVTVTGGSGDLRLGFTGVPRHVVARMSYGDVTIGLPRGRAYNVRATAVEGNRNIGVRQDPGAPTTIEASTAYADVTVRNASDVP